MGDEVRPDFAEDSIHIGHPRIVACTREGHSAAVCAFSGSLLSTLLLVAAGVAFGPKPVSALPSFARQTGQPCSTCHSAFPQLTPYGRRFKLEGYTAGGTRCGPSEDLAERELQIPIAGMTIPNFTHINKKLDPADTPKGFNSNDNTFDEATSVFFGGQIYCNFGAFSQGTYERPGSSLVFGQHRHPVRQQIQTGRNGCGLWCHREQQSHCSRPLEYNSGLVISFRRSIRCPRSSSFRGYYD